MEREGKEEQEAPKSRRLTVTYHPEMAEVIDNQAEIAGRKKSAEISHHTQYYYSHLTMVRTGATIIARLANNEELVLSDQEGERLIRPNVIAKTLNPKE